jgi:DNA polymerase III epsilon subunit-like protein
MSSYIVFDTETTGLPVGSRSHKNLAGYEGCRVVSIAMIHYDENHTPLRTIYELIKPEGYTEMPDGAFKVHGITYQNALSNGKSFLKLFQVFDLLLEQTSTVVGHNVEFDINVMKAEAFRRGIPLGRLETVKPVCTQQMTKAIYNKSMKLTEVYHLLFGEYFEGAHNALSDTLACAKVYTKLLEHKPNVAKELSFKKVIIKASEVAACIGKNPYKKSSEVLDDMWKRYSPETFTGTTKTDRAMEALEHSEAAKYVLNSAMKAAPKNSDEAEKVFKQAAVQINNNLDLSNSEKKEVLDHIRSKVYTSFGTKSEDKTADKVTEDENVKLIRDDTFYRIDVANIEGTKYTVVGKIDRIEEREDGSRVLVEIKNRTRGLFGEVRVYEMIQVQTYLQMLGLEKARLVEQYNNETNSKDITRDDKLWNETILPGLVEFCSRLHRNMSV